MTSDALPDLSPHRVIGLRRIRRAVMLDHSTAIKGDVHAEVDRLLAEFDQDPRYEASISKGYVRGSGMA